MCSSDLEHLGLVRELDIVRTPAVLVLDAAGREVGRAYGQPRTADVIAALGAAVAEGEEGEEGDPADGGGGAARAASPDSAPPPRD